MGSSAQFQIRHFGVANVHGPIPISADLLVLDAANPANSHVEVTTEAVMCATALYTHNALRDGHIRGEEYLNIAKYPTLTFKSTSVKRRRDGKLQIVGDLTLVGQTRSITPYVEGPATPQKGKLLSGFSTSGMLSRSAFKFAPKSTPLALGDQVKFTIDLEVTG